MNFLPKKVVHSLTRRLVILLPRYLVVLLALSLLAVSLSNLSNGLLVTSVPPAFAQDEDATGADTRTTASSTKKETDTKTEFSQEIFKQRVSPAKLKSDKPVEEFLQPVYATKAPLQDRNAFEKIISFFANLISGNQGFVNFIRPGKSPSWGEGETGIGLAAGDLQKSLYPAGRAPSGTSQFASAGNIPSDLAVIFDEASTKVCVPKPILLAIAEIEGGSMFSFTPEEIKRFSTPNWWVGASEEELKRGRCTNSCEPDPVNKCPAVKPPAIADVRGAMQFLIGTWQGPPEAKGEGGHVPEIRKVLAEPATYHPERCNLRDVIVGSAIKMKANSATPLSRCTTWEDEDDEEDIVRRVAAYYYGGGPNTCITTGGWNYCDRVWANYQKYSSSPPTPTQSQNVDLGENIPGLVHQLVGKSVQGKNIVVYKFGTGSKKIAFIGGIHEGSPSIGGEGNSRDFIIKAVDHFKTNGVPADTTAYFIPTTNPDAAANDWLCNKNGVNLNRNWGANFNAAAVSEKASTYGCKSPDSGDRAFSEPENRAVRDFLGPPPQGQGITKAIWYHSARPNGEVIPGVTDYSQGRDTEGFYKKSKSKDFAKTVATANGYTPTSYDTLVSGDASDWFDINRGPAAVIEFSTHDILSSEEFNRNIKGMVAAMKF